MDFRAIPQEILDDGFLKQNELDSSQWVIDSPLFLYGDVDINSEEYHEAVLRFVEGNGAIFMQAILKTLKDSRYDINADGARQTACTIAGYFYTVKQENASSTIYL